MFKVGDLVHTSGDFFYHVEHFDGRTYRLRPLARGRRRTNAARVFLVRTAELERARHFLTRARRLYREGALRKDIEHDLNRAALWLDKAAIRGVDGARELAIMLEHIRNEKRLVS